MRPRWWRLALALAALTFEALFLAGIASLGYSMRYLHIGQSLTQADVDARIREANLLGVWAAAHGVLVIVAVIRRGRLWQAAFVLVQAVDIGFLVTRPVQDSNDILVHLVFAILSLTVALAVMSSWRSRITLAARP